MPTAHLTAFLSGVGYHESAWRLAPPEDIAVLARPTNPDRPPGPDWFSVLERSALAAERGLLDAVFFADSPGLEIFRARYFPQVGFDPLEILAALSRLTSRIGLIATASTTYSAPYDLARRFATIDHLSDGRAGWNIVTTRYAGAAGNFGLAAHPSHADRYARAAEFVDVVTRLWESWDAAARHGRAPDSVLVLPGVAFVLGDTETSARSLRSSLEDLVDPEFRWRNLAHNAGLDASLIDPDKPLPEEVIAAEEPQSQEPRTAAPQPA